MFLNIKFLFSKFLFYFSGHKADYLKSLISDHAVLIHAAYGSSKDISVYTAVGLKERQIFIIGKVIVEFNYLWIN